MNEGWLDEVACEGTFGATIQLSRKALKWVQKGGSQGTEPLEFVPNQELAAEEKPVIALRYDSYHNVNFAKTGPTCSASSELTKSLVNVPLKFQILIPQICQYFC